MQTHTHTYTHIECKTIDLVVEILQTPFNFGAHPVDMEQEHVRKELPKTRAALLDFHANQNPAVKHKV